MRKQRHPHHLVAVAILSALAAASCGDGVSDPDNLDSGVSAPVAAVSAPVATASAPIATASAPARAQPSVMAPDQQLLFNLINASRAARRLAPYAFSAAQSAGTSACPGSLGHSVHMAQRGQISHDQFPRDICISSQSEGENVGFASGSEASALRTIHQNMMAEGPGGAHFENLMSAQYNTVGIGISYVDGILWLTEDFIRQ